MSLGKKTLADAVKRFDQKTRDMKAIGMVCASCERNDELFTDLHGTFCGRCGPCYPLKQRARAHGGDHG